MRTKLDNRIRTLIENGVISGYRSMFAIVGQKGKDQVVILHHILSKSTVASRPTVLWCYKKELGFSTHRKKRIKEIKRLMKTGAIDKLSDDPFDIFISSTNIKYCYYSETHRILGSTSGMLVLQDFEAITPNLLARTIETVEGGGVIVLLLKSVNSLRQLYTMTMEVHSRYRTEAHSNIIPRFNERFILSLADCRYCAVVDDRLNILPLSSHVLQIEPLNLQTRNQMDPNEEELLQLKSSLNDTKPIGPLLGKCKTNCQAKALLRLLDVITKKDSKVTCSISAARGRGKSAALGLAVAGAIGFGFANIFVTSPSPDNLKTLFEFIVKGFEAMGLEERTNFELIQSTNPELKKAVVRVNVLHDHHRQFIQYVDPRDWAKVAQAELVVIDEAAAIPLPFVKNFVFGPYLVFLASTVDGYEGTGRSLSLKLLQQLRKQITDTGKGTNVRENIAFKERALHEIFLEESIRYKPGDHVESWLNRLLCLNANTSLRSILTLPPPSKCELLYVNRDTLFSFHKASEAFLHSIMSICVSAHYKNSPNDLLMLSDAPAHHLFVLVAPINENQARIPDVLAIIQVCLEGAISKSTVSDNSCKGKRAAGDLLPWTIFSQYSDDEFPSLHGARIVRIAVHPDYHRLGYGTRAVQLLKEYYEAAMLHFEERCELNCEKIDSSVKTHDSSESLILMEENIEPRANLPPLLNRLTERRAERVDYLGVSFGLTLDLLKFWKRLSFVPIYLRQSVNSITGEHTCIMLETLDHNSNECESSNWLVGYWSEFHRRVLRLMSCEFAKFPVHLALSLLQVKNSYVAAAVSRKVLSRSELKLFLQDSDLRRVTSYCNNMIEYHSIADLLPILAELYFYDHFDSQVQLSSIQLAILLGVGIQRKTVDSLTSEFGMQSSQIMALLNKSIKIISRHLDSLCIRAIEKNMGENENSVVRSSDMEPMPISLQQDLSEAVEQIEHQQIKYRQNFAKELRDFGEFAVKGSEDDWNDALGEVNLQTTKNLKGLVSVKSNQQSKKVDIPSLIDAGLSSRRKRKKN